jgi:oligopeptide transport system substrate-binding protein
LQEDPANLTVAGWTADYPDPDGMLRTVFHSTDGLNRPRWHNRRFNTLVNEAAKLNDPYQRIELYRDADRILVAEQAAAVPLGYGRGRMLVKPWVYYPESLYNPLLIRFFEKRKNEFS